MIPAILNLLSTLSWRLETGIISVLLFGEYQYPSKSGDE